MKTRTNWIFICPEHGIEEGFLCDNAYLDEYVQCWVHVKYKPQVIKTSDKERKEWLHTMKLTREYHGVLPR